MKQQNFWGYALALLLLTSCGQSNTTTTTSTPAPSDNTSSPSQADTTPPTTDNTDKDDTSSLDNFLRGEVDVNLVMLTGPTGMGAAKLIADNEAGQTLNPYNVTMLSANDQAVAMLTSGEADIVALSTSVAATLYNKTSDISMLAVNTLGVLYILEKGNDTEDALVSVEDLRGKTIWTTGQGANPEYILHKLLTQAGLDPETDVTIEWMTAEEVSAKMISAESGVAMLPVPASTALCLKDDTVVEAIDLSSEWDRLVGSSLPMGCVVVRNEFLNAHPDVVASFLVDYEMSILYMLEEGDDQAQLVADAEITPSVAVAEEALPKANLTFVTGSDMQAMLRSYYVVLYQANTDSIGGGQPYDDFYFGAYD